MSTFVYEGDHSFYLGAQATLINTEREIASEWAAGHIQVNEANAWIVGKFVEANQANKNQQYFALGDLQLARPTITHAPMNINHHTSGVVGSFVASEMVYPAEAANDGATNPYIETLGVLWKYYFPEAYSMVAAAARQGELFFSMEAVPSALSTIGGTDDERIYPYEGRQSPNYSSEINERTFPIKLHGPHFVGGALVIPPEKPAWSDADAKQVANYMDKHFKQLEMAYDSIRDAAPHLEPAQWESLMASLIGMSR